MSDSDDRNNQVLLGRLAGLTEGLDRTLRRVEGKVDAIDERVRKLEQHKTGEEPVTKFKAGLRTTLTAGFGGLVTLAGGWVVDYFKSGGGAP